jgi:peptidoglycan L-alanyl-D-glutamate endopeptidase CwlK
MKLNRAPVFAAVRTILLTRTGKTFTPGEIAAIDAAFDEIEPDHSAQAVAPAPAPAKASGFALSKHSQDELLPVHPKLRQCVELAITLTDVDFRVNQGLRTVEEQKKAVASGNSRTMHSKHLRQSDGYVWAVDLVALDKNGDVTWDFNTYGHIAFAMDQAATKLGLAGHIRWGCAWDRALSDFGGSLPSYVAEANAYAKRHAGSDLLDAPHFEWVA